MRKTINISTKTAIEYDAYNNENKEDEEDIDEDNDDDDMMKGD